MSLSNLADTPNTGQLIAGRFRIEDEIGEGGMARVFRVTDIATSGTFALKLLKPEIAGEAEAVARLRREGEVLASLSSPAVVGIETFGRLDDGRLFLVMEYLQGETLGQRMRRDKQIAPAELAPIVTGAAAGLQAAHEAGIVHRDLKPDNIFLEQKGDHEPFQVRLLDFGISKVYDQEERLTRTGQILGTPRYMSPEQLAADHDLDARVDIYALGVILYEALVGSPPFLATTPSDLIVAILHGKVTPLRTLCPHLPPAIEEVVARAMNRNREARFQTALELADAFLAAAGSPQVRAKPAGAAGKRTSVMGGAVITPELPETQAAESLEIGTFSAFAQAAPPTDAPSAFVAAATEPTAPTVPERPSQKAKPTAPVAAKEPGPPPTNGTPPAPQPPEGTWPAEVSNEFDRLPTRSRTWLWLVAALMAGAVSAAIAIFLFERAKETSEQTSPPVEPQSALGSALETTDRAPLEPATTKAHTPEGPTDDASEEEAMEPLGQEAPPPAAAAPETRQRRRRLRASRRARADSTNTSEVPQPFVAVTGTMPNEGGDDASTALEEARAALRAGDPRRCLEVLDQRHPHGAAALRLEGDCYLRSGDRNEAVKSYERLCIRHPAAAASVRELVRSLGGACP